MYMVYFFLFAEKAIAIFERVIITLYQQAETVCACTTLFSWLTKYSCLSCLRDTVLVIHILSCLLLHVYIQLCHVDDEVYALCNSWDVHNKLTVLIFLPPACNTCSFAVAIYTYLYVLIMQQKSTVEQYIVVRT